MDGKLPEPAPRAPSSQPGRGLVFRPRKPSCEPARLSEAQAAYLLGHRRYAIWMWHEVFWAMPDFEGTGESVLLAVDQLRAARLALAARIHRNVFQELPRVLDDFVGMTRALIRSWKDSGGAGEHRFGSPIVPGKGHWQELLQLGDHALEESSPLRTLDQFGAALGRYQLEIWRHGDEADGLDEYLASLPDISALLAAAKLLPAGVIERIEWVGELMRPGSGPDHSDQVAVLRKLLRIHYQTVQTESILDRGVALTTMFAELEDQVYRGLAEVAPESDDADREGDQAAPMAIRRGDPEDEVIHGLAGVTGGRDGDSQGRGGAVPTREEDCVLVWNRPLGELRLNGILIRKVGSNGRRIITVLEAFQETGWGCRVIDDPLSGPRDERQARLYETVKSLNSKLIHIKFHVTNRGESIRWDLA